MQRKVGREGIFCRDANEVSLELALFAIGASGGFAHMQAVQGGAQERQFSLGAGALVERLAGELRTRVRLQTMVRRIEHTADGACVFADGLCVRAQRVVLAIPPPLTVRLEFEPALSSQRWRVMSKTKMGRVIKYNIIYPEPFWRQSGRSGALWSTSGPVDVCYDTSPPGSAFGALSALSVAAHAHMLGALYNEQRRKRVLDALATHFGPEARDPVEYFNLVWAHEACSEGGYSVTLPPGCFESGAGLFSAPEGAIHFAGTETAAEYPGYMEGALESAERATRAVLAELA